MVKPMQWQVEMPRMDADLPNRDLANYVLAHTHGSECVAPREQWSVDSQKQLHDQHTYAMNMGIWLR